MIKLMMLLSFLGLSLHAFGGTHDGKPTAPSHKGGRTTIGEGEAKASETEEIVQVLEEDLANALATKLGEANVIATCPDCPFPARPVGEVATL